MVSGFRKTIPLGFGCLILAAPLSAQTAADSSAIRAAALDYIEGWYEGDAGRAASVRVDATGWIDYMHLAEVDGRWVIINVLWETRPR